MDEVYIIFCKSKKSFYREYDLLNFTTDYFYYKRLMNKYKKENLEVYGRLITFKILLENSTVGRF